MAARQDIDLIVRRWPFRPGRVSVRRVKAKDGREVLQMRIDMGLLQMEREGRPDGARPGGHPTYLDCLLEKHARAGDGFVLTEQQCLEMDREFLQYYHRRVCWLALREFHYAVKDADHTLALMDFVAKHSPYPEWTASHEQYRPFVLFHRTQAAALAELEHQGPDRAIGEINRGLEQIRAVYEETASDDRFDHDEQVAQLVQLKEWVRQRYQLGPTLDEQLAAAIAAERYEQAAEIRDLIARRDTEKPAQSS